MDRAELADALELSTDDLLIELAERQTSGVSPVDPRHKLAIGKAIFEGWLEELSEGLCDKFRAADEGGTETRARDAAFILDLLLAYRQVLPIATLAVLIARHGLDRLCAE